MFKFSIRNSGGLLQPIEVHHLRQYLYLMGAVSGTKTCRYGSVTTDDICADVLAELVSQSCGIVDKVSDKGGSKENMCRLLRSIITERKGKGGCVLAYLRLH